MAFLKVVKGSCPGLILELDRERTVLGRHPHCEVVLENAAVSRHHAQILENHGHYFLEDLRSRNRTFLNGDRLEGRTELNEGDEISVCDIVFSFHLLMQPLVDTSLLAIPRGDPSSPVNVDAADRETLPDGDESLSVGDEPNEKMDDSSSIISTLSASSSGNLRLGVKPEAKLRAVLEIGNALANVLDLDEVLQKTLDGFFKIFNQADEGFVLLRNEEKKLIVRATKSRGSDEIGATVRISMTVVTRAMQTGEAILSADAVKDQRFVPSDSLTDLKIRSMMCVPLLGQSGKALGVIQIDTKDLQQQFSLDDLEVLVSVATQVSLAVENARLHEELLQQRDIHRELDFATQVQLGFLPSQRPKLPGYEFHDFYEAALRVGGDYFDYIALSDGRVVVALGDVAGKGVPAALLMARLYSSARFHLLTQSSVAKALTGLNAEIASSGLGHRFITFVVAVVNAITQEVTIANAGHLPPLLRHCNGEVESIAQEESGMPLGVVPSQEFHEATVELQPGEILTLYTDGVTEAMNPQNEIYGRDRLARFISESPSDVEAIIEGIITDMEEFCEGRPQHDDVCLVCIGRSKLTDST